ncbi:MAG: hypothetical protein HFH68_16385, partial [Lachnospiraceae bacterium]|nr:hypothetical protein [Lachnospiraceae bacterium]
MYETLEQLVINNSTIDRVEKQIQEATSVLKYSLYLEPIEIKTAKEDFSGLLIEKANEEVYKNFKPFTNDNTYNIFGCRERYHKKDLSDLDSCYSFWKHVFKQHAILSAYDRLRKILGQSVELTSYNFCKYSNYTNHDNSFDVCHNGLDYILGLEGNNGYDKLAPDKLCLNKGYGLKVSSATISQCCSNHARRIKSLYNKMANLDLHNPITHGQEPQQAASLDLLEFYEFSVRRQNNANHFKMLDILNVYKKKHIKDGDYQHYAVSVTNIFDTIKSESANGIKHKLSLSDRIYLAYEIEKI